MNHSPSHVQESIHVYRLDTHCTTNDEKIQETPKFPKNRRYSGLRHENGMWIQWIPSPALAKWKTKPLDAL
jgi:hypothetical protein